VAIAVNNKTIPETVAVVVGGHALLSNPKPHFAFRSTDGGKNWKDIAGDISSTGKFPLSEVRMMDCGKAIIAGTDGMVFWSQDWGKTWSPKKLGSTSAFVALDAHESGLVLVAAEHSSQVFLSKDSGYLFSQVQYTSTALGNYKTAAALDGLGTAYIGSQAGWLVKAK